MGHRGFGEWADTFGAAALLRRLRHRAVVIPIEGNSHRLREDAALIPEHMRSRHALNEPMSAMRVKRRPGRPLKAHHLRPGLRIRPTDWG